MKRLWLGALGGALGGVAMKTLVTFFDQDSFGLSTQTDTKAAHAAWRKMRWPALTDEQAAVRGAAMHYVFATGAGAFYGVAADRFPLIRAGKGTLFGALLWLFGDEVSVTLARLENPLTAPGKSHASALAAHLVFGAMLDVFQSTEQSTDSSRM